MRQIAVLTLVAGLLAGCGLFGGGATERDLDGAWVLTRADVGQRTLDLPPGSPVTLVLDGATVGGTAACNSYFGTLDRSKPNVTFSELGATEMACAPDLMEIERAYLDALPLVEVATVQDGVLAMVGAGVMLRFERDQPVADRELIGTEWVLETLLDGDAATSTTGDTATLSFDEDGTFEGSTGCRTFSGTYVRNGSSMVASDFLLDDAPCEQAGEQDEQVLSVVRGGFTVEIDGDQLTVAQADDPLVALVYRAG